MRLLYSLLLTLLALLLLPYFLWQGLAKGKYLCNLLARLGFGRVKVGGEAEGPVIWLHAVSVGETLAARPLCRALKLRYPGARLFLTTTTATGQAVAKAQVPEADIVGYYPFDWTFAVRRMLDLIEPELVILMESELWLNFLSECRERRIPVVVANGRISDRSFPRSMRVRFFVGRLYRLVTRFIMQSEIDAARAIALGATAEQVEVGGNLKYDVEPATPGATPGVTTSAGSRGGEVGGLAVKLGLATQPLIIAGSTHPGEEEIVLAAFQELRRGGQAVRLLIAPRHPERFDEVAELIRATGLGLTRRSMVDGAASGDESAGTSGVILLDSIGELASLYQMATVVLVGGSLMPIGGHNILEPALAGRPVVVGPHMHNFREMTAEFQAAAALIQIRGGSGEVMAERLRAALASILGDPELAREMGERARRTVEANRGATTRTCDSIARLLDQTA